MSTHSATPSFMDKVRSALSPVRVEGRSASRERTTDRADSSRSLGQVAEEEGRGRRQHNHPKEGYISTGRGGAGNIVRSPSRGPSTIDQRREEETIARTMSRSRSGDRVKIGRGGAGNYRSPSRDPAERAKEDEYERRVISGQLAKETNAVHSFGRGGAGNVIQGAPVIDSNEYERSLKK